MSDRNMENDYTMVPSEDTQQNNKVKINDNPSKLKREWRNLVAYWLLGLCNNYGYVVMLSAAHDIIQEQGGERSSVKLIDLYRNNGTVPKDIRSCNIMSTGAILLADILPALLIKFLAPFFPFYIHIRMIIAILTAAAGLLMVAFSTGQWLSISGVVLTSFSSGLGEVTLLQYSSFYDKNVLSTWSSGTGGAGIVGALSYAGLNKLGLQKALLIMLIVPVAMAISFWIILKKPTEVEEVQTQQIIQDEENKDPFYAAKNKVKILPGLMKYMIPLGLVYLFEYFINQGMFELINFDGIFITPEEQYRWLQVDYQIGVFLSRSSVNIFHIKRIWLMALLQFFNVFIFTFEAIYYFIPSFYIVLILTLWEGLLGGAAYVNTFYKMSSEVPEEEKQFSLGVTSFADSIGITFAGIFSLLAHNAICELPKPDRLTF